MFDLNQQQKQAVEHGEGPLMIVAGAGTGKTTVITRRMAHLIETGKAEADEILAVTFTEKAAEEMEERVDGLISESYLDLWISTFHSFAHRVLEDHGIDIGLPGNFEVLDSTQGWLLVRNNLDQFDLDYYRPMGNPTKFIHALIDHFGKCKNEGITPDDYREYADELRLNLDNFAGGSKEIEGEKKKELTQKQEEADRIEEVASAYETYQKLLLDNNRLDYGDLLNYTVKLFQKRTNILKKYRNQFKYVLVDEFQDTNWIQYKLIQLLTKPQNNLTVCGDDDQSIFRFRGASFNNVLQFKDDYPEAKEIVLTKNYRSNQKILDFSYKFIQHNNPNRLEYQLNQVEEISERAENKGIDINEFEQINKRLQSQKDSQKGGIDYTHYKSEGGEKEGLIKKIASLYRKRGETTFDNFAILCRTNKQAQAYSRALERENLPNRFLSSKGLYSKPIVLDIISYFKLLRDHHESKAAFRVLNLPFFAIDSETQSLLTRKSKKKSQSLFQTLKKAGQFAKIDKETQEKIKEILKLIKTHSKLAQRKNTSEVFVAFLQDSGYLDYLTDQKEQNTQKKISYLNQFYERIKQFEESQIDPQLPQFLDQLQMEIEAGEEGKLQFDPEKGPEAIKIMTIHSAKGLEFRYVFIPQLVKRRFPTISRKDPIEIPEELTKEVTPKGDFHLQEERRLFYVASTRAKEKLFISSAEDYGGKRKKKPSRFLFETNLIKEDKEPEAQQTETKQNLNSKKKNKQEKTQPNYELPSQLSYTQFAAFDNCPLQYKFAHILKIPRKGSHYLSFGKSIHNTLYRFLKQYSKQNSSQQQNLLEEGGESEFNLSLEDLYQIYEEEWIDEWYKSKSQKDKYYKLGRESLKRFYQEVKNNRPQIETANNSPALEQNFHLNIADRSVKGKIDRIDKKKEGKVEIIDYKTGKPKDRIKKGAKKQLLIYQLAAERVFEFEVEQSSLYYFRDGSKLNFKGEKQDKEKIEAELKEQIETMKDSNFEADPGYHCKFCDFYDICEQRKEF